MAQGRILEDKVSARAEQSDKHAEHPQKIPAMHNRGTSTPGRTNAALGFPQVLQNTVSVPWSAGTTIATR